MSHLGIDRMLCRYLCAMGSVPTSDIFGQLHDKDEEDGGVDGEKDLQWLLPILGGSSIATPPC
jgi:hypothetical protein